MYEHSFTKTLNGAVFHYLNSHRYLTIDWKQRNSDGDDIILFLKKFGFEAILSYGVFDYGILDVPIVVVLCEGVIESDEFILLCNNLDISE